MLNATPLLQITLLKLFPFVSLQAQARSTQGRVHFQFYPRAVSLFPFAQYFSLLRTHFHPTLRVLLEYFSIFRWHRDPSIARIVQIWSMSRRRHSPNIRTLPPSLRLRSDRFGADDQKRTGLDCPLTHCVFASNRQ